MAKILIVYSTTDGQTLKICQHIQSLLGDHQYELELISVDSASNISLENYEKVVIGASIRYGKHNKAVYSFIRENKKQLENIITAFFSVNATARKEEKNTAETNPYVKKFLMELDWQPTTVDVFAGKIDYPKYGFLDRSIIRFIMWLTKGPTDPMSTVEFTDWQRVERFAKSLIQATHS